jgi:hypothetical protein
MQKWEYAYVKIESENDFNATFTKLGSEGWELVSADYKSGNVPTHWETFRLFFKRPKE